MSDWIIERWTEESYMDGPLVLAVAYPVADSALENALKAAGIGFTTPLDEDPLSDLSVFKAHDDVVIVRRI